MNYGRKDSVVPHSTPHTACLLDLWHSNNFLTSLEFFFPEKEEKLEILEIKENWDKLRE